MRRPSYRRQRFLWHEKISSRLLEAAFLGRDRVDQAASAAHIFSVRIPSFGAFAVMSAGLLGCDDVPIMPSVPLMGAGGGSGGGAMSGAGGTMSTGGASGGSVACMHAPLPVPGGRLLTRSEYRRTIQDLLATTEDPTVSFPEEPDVNGFNNNARSYAATPLLVEELDLAATSLAASAETRGFVGLAICEVSDERVCATSFISSFLRRAFRRPPTHEEETAFSVLYDRVAEGLGHSGGLRAIVEATLLSPQFLYRIEAPLPGMAPPVESVEVPLGPYELASRLSYFLWGTMPDDRLLAKAEAGELASVEGIELEARRLLESPRARDRVREFHALWLKTNRLPSIARDGAPPGFGSDLQRSLLAFLDDVFWAGGTTHDLLTTQVVYATPTLGALYGYAIEPTADLTKISPMEPRPGLLGQPGLLARLALAKQSSPIQRGVFVRDALLCAPVQNPPPSVNNNPPDPQPGLTTRELFRVHTDGGVCEECHRLIDPVGFGFEAYDQLGRYRTEQEGKPVDVSGSLDDVADPQMEGPYSGLDELSERLSTGTTVLGCMTRKWLEFGLGRAATESDSCEALSELESAGPDTPLIDVLVAIAKSRPFRMAPVAMPEEEP